MLILVLALHTVHAPIPVPDLDGECRGTPIHSLAEGSAWHPVLLGVRPNDDVDRGPIRTDEPGSRFDGSQFGELAIVKERQVAADTLDVAFASVLKASLIPLSIPTGHSRLHEQPHESGTQTVSIRLCRWQI
jgi:hypothetical protein